MSSLTSPPTGEDHVSHLMGIDQTPFDDFIPTSPDVEEFLQVSHRLSPQNPSSSSGGQGNLPLDYQDPSSYPASGSPSTGSHNRTPTLAPDPYSNHNRRGSHPSMHRQDHSTNVSPSAQTLDPSPASNQTHLSPSVAYSSDIGYHGISEHTTPSFEDDLFPSDLIHMPGLEEDDNPELAHTTNGIDLSYPAESTEHTQPLSITESSKQSLGTAIHPSVLMSPIDTDTTSLHSGQTSVEDGQLNHANLTAFDTHSFQQREHVKIKPIEIPAYTLQHTPALTGSSRDSSRENLKLAQMPQPPHLTSPVVKVENYSRGDSPSREGLLVRSFSKRSRTSHLSSGHLSPHVDDDGDSSEEEEGDRQHFQFRNTSATPSAVRAEDGSWVPSVTSGQAGVDPEGREQLKDAYVPNLKDQEERRKIMEKNVEVEHWLQGSAPSSVAGDDPSVKSPPSLRRQKSKSSRRRRAKSAGDVAGLHMGPLRLDVGVNKYDDSAIPGPGVLIEEESGEEENDEDSEYTESVDDTPPAPSRVDEKDVEPRQYSPPSDAEAEPLPRQFCRPRPWVDPPRWNGDPLMTTQPASSNAAIMRFQQRADNIETASRAATWGTRSMSVTDLDKFARQPTMLKRFSFGRDKDKIKEKEKEKGERKGSLFDMGKKLMPKRSNSHLKRKSSEKGVQEQNSDPAEKDRKESLTPLTPLRRASSSSKMTRSPKINTGSAVAAMAGQIAAIGGSGSVSATSTMANPGPWGQARNAIKRTRSKSELPQKPNQNLSGLMVRHGGPPMPTLASPPREEKPRIFAGVDMDDEDEDDELMDDKGVTMDLAIQAVSITPTLKGFRSQVRQLNPRLEPFLVDRISHEQVRRFKKLVDAKIKHLNAVKNGNCSSNNATGHFCFQLGGEAKIMPPKTSNRDTEAFAGFQVARSGTSDDESLPIVEGQVAAAQFPPGVLLPPVKRLPAEFECPLCFKIKKFQKPSDWTKHVHEDVQPFTCTFPNCAEPKSFKRKADWVRHENERHRQLEWWTCNLPDCSHVCYRKDNFVQHLVREHKKPEPKVKASKGGPKSAGTARSPVSAMDPSQEEVDKVWALVDECHSDTIKLPREEPCRFCGNICSSWKKLTVHLARHMEQISLPVLALVEQQNVTHETIISPIEQQRVSQQSTESPLTPLGANRGDQFDVSPYAVRKVEPSDDFEGAYGLQHLDLQGGGPRGQRIPQYPSHVTSYPHPGFAQGGMSSYPEATPNVYPSASNYAEYAASQRHVLPSNVPNTYQQPASQPTFGEYAGLSSNVPRSAMPMHSAPEVPMTAGYEQQNVYAPSVEGHAYGPDHSAQAGMEYSNLGGVSYTRAPQADPSIYMRQPQNYKYPQQ
ncbi:MAG: hypothetical protein M1833_004402 [Piccolia ochrophora]|nr:MAG: hypothetical protein M1833_004402 [Piccolia ochrophora]